MRLLRFSIRGLLLLTGLVAVLLYVLLIRPVTVAKSFIYTLEHAAPTEITKYLDDVDIGTDGVHVEDVLNERRWADIFTCRQTFGISVVRPDPELSTAEIIEQHACTSTPFGVNQQEPYLKVRERQ
jgi:hypothetical protein